MWYVCERKQHFKKGGYFFSQKITWILYFIFSALVLGCGGPPQNITEGSESPAQVVLTSDSVTAYPDIVNGLSYTYTITLQNLSSTVPADSLIATSTLSPPFSFTGGTFPGSGGDCGSSLPAGAQCTIEFSINPTVTGDYSAPININYFDGLADQSYSIELTATSRDPLPAIIAINPAGAHDFGPLAIGGFSDLAITVNNTGEQSATGFTLSGLSAPFSVVNDNCGATVAAMSSCQFTVRFAPVAAAVSNQTLQLDFNDGVSPQNLSKAFSGEGRIAGFLSIDEGLNFDYGVINQGFNSNRTLTVRNTGGGNASSISVGSLSAPFSVIANSCPATLAPAATCSLTVRYTPTATTTSNDTLDIDYFDGFNNQTTSPDFTGQGFNNAPTLSLISPGSSPSNQATPTIRVGNIITGVLVRLYQTNSCTVENTNNTSTGTTLDFSPTMPEGTYEFHARIEDSDGNLSACSAALVNYQYDNTVPNPPSNVTFATTFTTSSSSSPVINWTASPSGDVVDYQVGIDANPAGGNTEGGFTSKGNVTSATESGLSLTECNYYHASVQAVDHVGLTSATYSVSALSFRYDSAIPTTPGSLNEDGDGSTTNSATVTWNASSDNCGISHYEVAISEDTNANNILDPGESENVITFTNVGNITSHRFDAIVLNNGIAHFTSVRAVDTTGRASNIAISDPWIVYDPSIELPDMIVWLDGNDPSTIIDENGRDALDPAFTGNVDDWLDKSGSANTHNFRAVNGSSRPTYDDTNFTVDYDGATTVMTTSNHAEINTATVTQRNITVAFRTSGDVGTRQVLYEEGGNVRGMNIYIFNNQLYCGFYNTPSDGDGVQPFTSVNTGISTNRNYFVTWVFDYTNYTGPSGPDATLTCYLDGVAFGTTTSTSRLFAHSGAVGLGEVNGQSVMEDGSVPSSGHNFLGSMYEVMLFNNAPDAADVTNVHTYLDNKWN